MKTTAAATPRITMGEIARLACFLAATMGLLIWTTREQFNLVAFGCDAFGYARQAELFRHKGLWRGLDTRIDNAEVRQLTDLAGSILPDTDSWAEAVAPHCHHYNAASRHVILQYPPGTGFVLSLFRERVALACLFILGMTLMTGTFATFVAARRSSWIGLAACFSVLALIARTITHPDAFASASSPVTAMIVPVAAVFSFVAFPGPDTPRKLAALVFGAFCGLLPATRLPNALLLVGLAVQIALTMRLWRPAALKNTAPALLCAFAGFGLTGLVPVLAANLINAGGLLSTTYGSLDAIPPIIDRAFIVQGISYYFTTGYAAPALIGACAAFAVRLLTLRLAPPRDGICGASIGGFLALAISLFFFSVHENRALYYMLPTCTLALSLVALEIAGSVKPQRPGTSRWLLPALFTLPFILFAAIRLSFVTPFTQKAVLPQEIRSGKSIVWADYSSGTSYYYTGKYAAKLYFANRVTQDKLIDGLSALGWTQYFVLDSDDMKKIWRRRMDSGKMSEVGIFDTFGSFPVWKLPPAP